MAEKKITVVIDGQEFVSKAADDAGAGMDRFAKKQPGWVNGLADLKAGWDFLSKGIGYVREIIGGSISAFDAMVVSQRKMEGASKLTGLSLDYLNGIAAEGREKFGLSKTVANEYAVEMGKLEKVSGGASKATDLLSGFLEIGAARGLTAAESLQAAQQSILGIDEGTDKLFGKNPSGLWSDYEAVIGKSAGKFSDMEKQAALAYAVVEGGNKTLGSYAAVLESTAGKTELFKQKNEEAAAALGESLGVIRTLLLDTGTTTIPWYYDTWRRNFDGISSTIYNAQGTAFSWMATIAKVVGTEAQVTEYSEKSRKAFDKMTEFYNRSKMSAEELAKQNQKVTGSLQDVLPKAQMATTAFGGLIQPLGASTFAAKETAEAIGSIGPRAGMTAKEIESYGKMHVKTASEVKDETKKAEEAWKQYLKDYEAGIKRINEAYDSYLKLLPKLQPALQQSMQTVHIDGQNRALKESKEAADAAMKALREGAEPLPDLVKKSAFAISDMGGKLATAGRTAIEVGQAFGAMDDSTAATLTSVIQLGESIAKVAGGDMTAIPGMIASAANLISKMIGGDSARKKLIADNTTEMARLRNELGNLSLNVSGDDFAKIQSALGEVLPQLRGGRGAANTTDIVNALAKRGLGMGDLKKLADQLGIRIYSDSGALSVDGLKQLFESMGLVELGKFGQDYASQKDSVTTGFGVNKTNDLGQIGALGQLGGKFSSVLQGVVDTNDLSGTRSRLAGLFAQMNAGGISAEQLGGLTGSEFLDLITDIIGRIDNLSPNTGGGSSTGGTGGDAMGGGTTTTSGGVPVATKTLADVLDGVTAQTTALGAYHVQHLNIATEHLNEAKMQTSILSEIAESVRPIRDGGIANIADKGLEAERLALAAERGLGASY
jgi:hypothetical protein